MRERDDAVRCYFVPHFFSMVSQIFPTTSGSPRRAMQIAGARHIKSSCDAATWHQRDHHRLDGYQSSS
jgi:hypothetical protein